MRVLIHSDRPWWRGLAQAVAASSTSGAAASVKQGPPAAGAKLTRVASGDARVQAHHQAIDVRDGHRQLGVSQNSERIEAAHR